MLLWCQQRGTHLAQYYGTVNTSTTTCCTVTLDNPRSAAICCKVTWVCLVWMCYLMQAARTHAVKNLHHPLQMSPVTLSLLDGNLQHHFEISCMDITGYIPSHAYQLLTLHVPQKVCNFLGCTARPVFQVGHCAQLPELCSFCAYESNHAHEHDSPFILYINSCWISSSAHWKTLFYLLLYYYTAVVEECDLTLKIPHTSFCFSESKQTCFM